MAGRRFIVDWQHTGEDLFARYRAERDARLARRWQVLGLLRRGTSLREAAAAYQWVPALDPSHVVARRGLTTVGLCEAPDMLMLSQDM